MNTKENSINQVITALMELEAKGCHSAFFVYGNGQFHVWVYKSEINPQNIVYEKTINTNTKEGQTELDEMTNHVNNMKYCIIKTSFQCYRREFIKGEKSGEWEKVKPAFIVGENATEAMLIDGSGYYIDDPDNSLMYFVNMKKLSETE